MHFACHAKFNANLVDRSYLELGADERIDVSALRFSNPHDTSWPGQLTLAEIRDNLNLADCRLVTLSACQTSVIDPSRWDEFIGLPAAFMVAGANCVIGSLWEVSDISTAMLMQRFYRQFRQNPSSVALALHQAQKWVSEARAPAVAAFESSPPGRNGGVHLCQRRSDGRTGPVAIRTRDHLSIRTTGPHSP